MLPKYFTSNTTRFLLWEDFNIHVSCLHIYDGITFPAHAAFFSSKCMPFYIYAFPRAQPIFFLLFVLLFLHSCVVFNTAPTYIHFLSIILFNFSSLLKLNCFTLNKISFYLHSATGSTKLLHAWNSDSPLTISKVLSFHPHSVISFLKLDLHRTAFHLLMTIPKNILNNNCDIPQSYLNLPFILKYPLPFHFHTDVHS